MPTLILSPRYTPDSSALWRAALQGGWSVERLQSHRPPSWLRDPKPVIYGEAIFANVVADELSLALLEPPFNWLATLPDTYLQRSIQYVTLGDARKLTESAFVKPAYDKSFDAQVYESGAQLPSHEVLPDDMPVLIAEPVAWDIEFRCFILQRELITLSVYSRDGELAQGEDGIWSASQAETDEALTFANTLLIDETLDLPPAFVLDIGKIAGRGWAVVETNPAWASGIYGCDPARVLPVLQRTCVKQEELTPDDRRWVEQRLI